MGVGIGLNMAHLTETDLASYERDGFVALRGLFGDDEVTAYRDEAARLAALVSPLEPGKPRLQIEPEQDGGAYGLRMIEPLVDLSPVFAELTYDRRVVGPVEQVFGEKARLFEDKLNYKPPRIGSAFKLHQDQPYWDRFSERLISVFLHLDDADAGNGCLKVLPGCQNLGVLEFVTDGPDRMIVDERIAGVELVDMEMGAGDLLIFSSFTPHASEINLSDRVRRAMVYTYHPVSEGELYRYSAEVLGTYH